MAEFVTGARNEIAFWESKALVERRRSHPFGEEGYHVASLSWSSNNSKVVVAPKWGNRVAIGDLLEESLSWSYLPHKDGCDFTCGCIMHNNHYLLTGGAEGSVDIWDLKSKNIAKSFTGHSSPVTCVSRNASDHVVLSGAQNGNLLLHVVGTGQAVNLTKEETSKQAVTRLRFSIQEKTQVGSTSEDGSVSLWSVESQRLLTRFSPPYAVVGTDVCFSPSNNMLMVSVGMDARIRCWDIQQRKSIAVIDAPVALTSVTLLKDGLTLIGGGADGNLYVYELRSVKTPRQVIEAHQSAITCIAEQYSKSSRRGSSRGSRGSKGATPQLSSPGKSTSKPPAQVVDALMVAQTPFTSGNPPAPKGYKDFPLSTFATPACYMGPTDSSGIFSPLDANMTTPLPGGGKVTATVPPTMRVPESLEKQHPVRGSQVSKHSGMVHPHPGTVGLFSPLETATVAATAAAPEKTVELGPTPLLHKPNEQPAASRLPRVPVDGQSQVAAVPTPTTMYTKESSGIRDDLVVGGLFPARDRDSIAEQGSPALESPAVVESSHHPTVPPTMELPQMQYIENLIKESHEELRYAVHRDIRALSLDMFRQFFVQQQQFASALTSLNEKVERLNEENRKLQEQLHQYMPKH